MKWQDIVADPNLRDLPYKIETNERGQIVMTPARLRHGNYQSKVGFLLMTLCRQGGEVVMECAIQTSKGTKVADVGWFSDERWAQVKDEFDSPIAPEICVEVVSPANSTSEIDEKKQLYFNAKASEVWVCSAKGKVRFYTQAGELNVSALIPDFPKEIAK